ncbi:MAG: hypothetical protein KBC17_01590 [Candidatus Pacebacteria bacterium]|nr:hypothetical protein [Candidatus Paceibacterota bacterium]
MKTVFALLVILILGFFFFIPVRIASQEVPNCNPEGCSQSKATLFVRMMHQVEPDNSKWNIHTFVPYNK